MINCGIECVTVVRVSVAYFSQPQDARGYLHNFEIT
jgi:hypothetical protein